MIRAGASLHRVTQTRVADLVRSRFHDHLTQTFWELNRKIDEQVEIGSFRLEFKVEGPTGLGHDPTLRLRQETEDAIKGILRVLGIAYQVAANGGLSINWGSGDDIDPWRLVSEPLAVKRNTAVALRLLHDLGEKLQRAGDPNGKALELGPFLASLGPDEREEFGLPRG